jgi:hypothetical protein
LIVYFANRRKQWRLSAFQSSASAWRRAATGFRISPSIKTRRRAKPFSPLRPFIAIEILLSEDRMSRIRQKIADYLRFGIPYVW